MASSCCGTKKQKLNNYANTNGNTMASGSGYQSYNHHHHGQNHRNLHHRDRDREQNGGPGYDGSSMVTTNGHHQHNGICSPMNGIKPIDQIAVPDMCFFCFEVLYCELNNIDGPSDPCFTNDP